jgi:hypothetical protein
MGLGDTAINRDQEPREALPRASGNSSYRQESIKRRLFTSEIVGMEDTTAGKKGGS